VVDRNASLESTDLHLLRKCPCPVWIIRPNQRKPFAKILIAVDPDPSETERLKIDADLVKLGISLASRENAKVEVIHTWQLDGESMLRGPRFRMGEDEVHQLSEKVRSVRQKWLDSLLAPYAEHDIAVTLVKGPPGPTLVKFIEKKKPDIVVMGTVARSGLPGLLIGNTAEYVLGRISCSVLTIKPKGFKTPVS
jgi:nucleotide-binding universal stress UspA family protein